MIQVGDKVKVNYDTLNPDTIWKVLKVEEVGWMGETILSYTITDGFRIVSVTDECVVLVDQYLYMLNDLIFKIECK
jgi:hypothetical protein